MKKIQETVKKLLTQLLKRPFLLLFLAVLAFILVQWQSFLSNVVFYATGQVLSVIIKGEWIFAILNILFFAAFILLLKRRKANWKTTGVFTAFIISLFIEMYGFPLSIYAASAVLGTSTLNTQEHPVLFTLHLFNLTLAFDYWMTFGLGIIILGLSIIALGWLELWSSKKPLYTSGIYAFSRHPQYVGFLLLIWGWAIAWPTILTLAMAPVLTFSYIDAARKEEKELTNLHGYKEYASKTPFMV